MPHLVLEYSADQPAPVAFDDLFAKLHAALEDEGFPPAAIKSRAVRCDAYRVGPALPGAVFVHLTVAIFGGRELEKRQRISERLLALLREGFARAWDERPCDITVDVREIERATYGKAMNARAGGEG
jgi:5-carboxymethyl-2-hydroxymuconate isomerase